MMLLYMKLYSEKDASRGVIPSYPSKMQFFLSDSLQNFRAARNNASESENIFVGSGR